MTAKAHEALTKSVLETDETIYTLIKLPPTAIWAATGVLAQVGEAFSAVIADRHETTLILPLDAWQENFASRLPEMQQSGPYRLITFDIELELELVGFLALIAQIMAAAEVPIIAVSAFSRDHLLVPADKFQRGWDALKAAQQKDE